MNDGLGGIVTGAADGLPEGSIPRPGERDLTDILSHYPAEKPVCFNYMRARLDVLYLCEIVRQLRNQT